MSIEKFVQKIREKKSVISVIGLGYVGLPIAIKLADTGFTVKGFDNSASKINKLKNGISYIDDITNEDLNKVLKTGMFEVESNPQILQYTDIVLICVPTPLTIHKEPDISYIIEATNSIKRFLKAGMLIVLESTTFPGTTNDVMLPILENTHLKVGEDFFLGYSPERIDPGNKDHTFTDIPKVVSGITKNCLSLTKQLYDMVYKSTYEVTSTQIAESSKLLENIHRSVNIALVNEMKIVLDRLGIDIWEVVDAAATKPFGFTKYYPGPGLGGHCIPIDPFYLSWKAKEVDTTTRFIELAGTINRKMPYTVVTKIGEALNRQRKNYNGSNILILGIAYKKDIKDFRESPALKIILLLEEKGATVTYNDKYIPYLSTNWYNRKIEKKSWVLNYQNLNKYDCCVIITDHSYYNWDEIVSKSNIVVDTRNATKDVTNNNDKILKA